MEKINSMIRIAIVDDDKDALDKVCNLIEKYCQTNPQMVYRKKYSSANELKWDLEEKKEIFDIYILDIEIGDDNGIDVARFIRTMDEQAYIIFLTSYMQYSLEGYECNAYRYVLKSQMEEKLSEIIGKICKKLVATKSKIYIIEKQNVIEKIEVNEIIYLYKESKNTYFVLDGRITRDRKPINEIISELGNTQFVMLDKGIAVNLEHVMGIHNTTVTLRNGVALPCSRMHIKQLRNAIRNNWGLNS